jgi:Calpain family cysteine protease
MERLPLRARDQRGQTSAEYVGVLAFVVAVVAVLLLSAPSIAATVVDKVQEAICSITGGDCGGASVDGEGDEVGATGPTSGEDGDTSGGENGDDTAEEDESTDPSDADPEIVEQATEDIRDELDGGFWGSDHDEIAEILEGLDAAEFNAVMANLSDDELTELFAGMGQGFWGEDEDDRRAFFNSIAQKASPETLERIMALTDDLDPRFDDVEHDGLDDTDYEDLAGNLFLRGDDDNDIHPNDIDQQGLGDCYLLASLAEIAQQNPELIRDIVRPNDNGTFTVTFYDDGDPVEIVVGPHIPADDGSTVFAGPGDEPDGSDNPELWVMLIEKAYAQYHGSYGEIEGGFTNEALEHLTGSDSDRSDADDVSIESLDDALDGGSAITVETLSSDDGEKKQLYEDSELYSSHAYYVTDVDPEAGTVTIRNPWGTSAGETVLTFEEFQDNLNAVVVNDLERD